MNKILLDITINSSNSLKECLKKIEKNTYGVCFVLKNKKVINVISDGDIRRALLKNCKLSSKVYKIKKNKFYYVYFNYNLIQLYKKIDKYKVVPILTKNKELIDFATKYRVRQIPQAEPNLTGNELKYVSEAINSGWISSRGKFVNEFEKKFKEKFKFKYCLTASNGTAALHLALASLGLKENDEVIVPNYTFVSPINTIIYTKAKPVLVDVNYNDMCINIDSVLKNINSKTKAIIAVHLYGHVAQIKELKRICSKKNIFLIEDCAESIGTYVNKRSVGSFGDISTFSFFANKTITTGEGGMVVFNNKKTFELARNLRDHGMLIKRYWHNQVGFNYRLTNIQSAIGVAQLEKLDLFLEKKKNIFLLYSKYFSVNQKIDFPYNIEKSKNSYWLFYIKLKNLGIKDKNYEKYRDKMVDFLNFNGIEARHGFYAASLMKIYEKYKSKTEQYKNSLLLSQRIITLPSSINLKPEEIKYISSKVLEFLENN